MATTTPVTVQGHCDARFKAVEDAFRENFEFHGDIGASVAICLDGQLVVDLWGGYMDRERIRPWHRDTLVNTWSLGKAMTALALMKAVDRGLMRYEDRIADYWPEFAAAGKADITIATALAHRAGLPAIERPLPEDGFFNWQLMTDAIAAQRPWWAPGTNHGYHTNTFGFLLGEPLRRATGSRLRDFLNEQITRPLGVDFFMGVPAAELDRVASLTPISRPANAKSAVPTADAGSDDPMMKMRHLVYTNPPIQFDNPDVGVNSRAWHLAEFPSTSPQSNARAVATVFGHLAGIVHHDRAGIVSAELMKRATRIESDGEDLVVQRPTRFGLGFQLTQPDRPLGPNPGSFGHYGNGGHIGFADPAIPLGFAWHMNLQGYAWRDPRNIALTDAMYESLR